MSDFPLYGEYVSGMGYRWLYGIDPVSPISFPMISPFRRLMHRDFSFNWNGFVVLTGNRLNRAHASINQHPYRHTVITMPNHGKVFANSSSKTCQGNLLQLQAPRHKAWWRIVAVDSSILTQSLTVLSTSSKAGLKSEPAKIFQVNGIFCDNLNQSILNGALNGNRPQHKAL